MKSMAPVDLETRTTEFGYGSLSCSQLCQRQLRRNFLENNFCAAVRRLERITGGKTSEINPRFRYKSKVRFRKLMRLLLA